MQMAGKGNFANFHALFHAGISPMFRCRLIQIFLAQYTIQYGSAFTPQRVHHFVVLGQLAWLAEEAIVEILSADSGQFVGRCTENCSACRLLLREIEEFKNAGGEFDADRLVMHHLLDLLKKDEETIHLTHQRLCKWPH